MQIPEETETSRILSEVETIDAAFWKGDFEERSSSLPLWCKVLKNVRIFTNAGLRTKGALSAQHIDNKVNYSNQSILYLDSIEN